MSVAGIDFGNLSLLIAQAGKGGVDVILNDSSNRQTATFVSIQDKQRFIGDAAAAMARSNVAYTVSGMKMLVGRQFDDADVQKEIARQPYKCVKMSHGGVGVVMRYNDEEVVMPVEHLLAVLLVKAKTISANAAAGVNLADAVLAVPFWYTDSQRRALIHACQLAELNCLKIANEATAIALSYGIFKSAKKLFSETDYVHIMFIDMGYTGYSVTIVDFKQEQMKVRSTACAHNLSGREFDDIIIEFLAESFQKKTGINVRNNKKAILKLQAAAEKAKKTLSPHGVTEASVSVECLAEDRDLSIILTKEEFESRAAPLIARLREPVDRALQEAGLSPKDISEVEIVGGSSRINIVKRTLGQLLGLDPQALNYGLKTTMNADEAVARGNALQCAMLSSRMKVKPFAVVDRLPYSIRANFEATHAHAQAAEDSEENHNAPPSASHSTSAVLYNQGDEIPHKPRRITFRHKTSDFTITASYDGDSVLLPPGESRLIGKYTVRVPAGHPPSDVRVTFHIDKFGLLAVQSAHLMLEVEETEDEKKAAEGKEGEAPKKTKYRKVDLEVIANHPGLTASQLKEFAELEARMANQDRLITETADKRNEVEAYIYSMRDKIDGVLRDYATSSEKEKLTRLLQDAEDWLYGDGFEAAKSDYITKLGQLQAVGNPIDQRYLEAQHRPQAVDNLKKQADLCKAFASTYDEATSHITEEERGALRKEIAAAESWLYDMLSKQGELSPSANPVLTVDGINARRNTLFNAFMPLKNKPKPAPTPKEEPKSQGKDAKEDKQEKKEGSDSVPMEEAAGGPEAK
eukprot:gene8469-9335_t